MHDSQLSGTAKVVSKGGIMAAGTRDGWVFVEGTLMEMTYRTSLWGVWSGLVKMRLRGTLINHDNKLVH